MMIQGIRSPISKSRGKGIRKRFGFLWLDGVAEQALVPAITLGEAHNFFRWRIETDSPDGFRE